MKLLAIDTSTRHLSLAAGDEARILAARHIKLRNVLSSSIIPGIEKILRTARIPLGRLDGFVVGLGPGSFTSLRVGISVIKGMAFAADKPVIGISSLDVLAMGVGRDGPICVICDAKRSLVYAAFFEKSGGALTRTSAYRLTNINEILSSVKGAANASGKKITFTGDGIGIFRKEILEAGADIAFTPPSAWSPQAKYLLAMARRKFTQRKFDSIDKLRPLYLYPEDCQVGKSGTCPAQQASRG